MESNLNFSNFTTSNGNDELSIKYITFKNTPRVLRLRANIKNSKKISSKVIEKINNNKLTIINNMAKIKNKDDKSLVEEFKKKKKMFAFNNFIEENVETSKKIKKIMQKLNGGLNDYQFFSETRDTFVKKYQYLDKKIKKSLFSIRLNQLFNNEKNIYSLNPLRTSNNFSEDKKTTKNNVIFSYKDKNRYKNKSTLNKKISNINKLKCRTFFVHKERLDNNIYKYFQKNENDKKVYNRLYNSINKKTSISLKNFKQKFNRQKDLKGIIIESYIKKNNDKKIYYTIFNRNKNNLKYRGETN